MSCLRRREGAAAYWIDSIGDKLVYKNKACVKNGVDKCTARSGLPASDVY